VAVTAPAPTDRKPRICGAFVVLGVGLDPSLRRACGSILGAEDRPEVPIGFQFAWAERPNAFGISPLWRSAPTAPDASTSSSTARARRLVRLLVGRQHARQAEPERYFQRSYWRGGEDFGLRARGRRARPRRVRAAQALPYCGAVSGIPQSPAAAPWPRGTAQARGRGRLRDCGYPRIHGRKRGRAEDDPQSARHG
jgi:hypothetical protein